LTDPNSPTGDKEDITALLDQQTDLEKKEGGKMRRNMVWNKGRERIHVQRISSFTEFTLEGMM
jgi:hypothetical protein